MHACCSTSIWRFPEIGVPPVVIHFGGIFPDKPSILRYPHLWKPPFRVTTWLRVTLRASPRASNIFTGFQVFPASFATNSGSLQLCLPKSRRPQNFDAEWLAMLHHFRVSPCFKQPPMSSCPLFIPFPEG